MKWNRVLSCFLFAALVLCSTLSASFQNKSEALRGSKSKIYVEVRNVVFVEGCIVVFVGNHFFETRCIYSDKRGYYVYCYDLNIVG